MDPLDLLIEDCWLHLFQFLSAEDKHSLCQTSASFHAMLEPEKVTWGLELVLPYIMKDLSSDFSYRYNDRFKKAMISALTLRKVCKSWRAGFDKFCGALDFQRHSSCGPVVRTIQRKYHFKEVSSWEKFLTFFKDHQGNPFIGRIVSIYAMSIGAEEEGYQEEEKLEEEMDDEKEMDDEDIEASENIGIEEAEDVDEENEEYEEEDDFDEEEYEDWRAYDLKRRESILKNRQLVMELLSKFGKEIDNLYLGRWNNCSLQDAYKFLQIILCNCENLQSLELYMYEYFEKKIDKSGYKEEQDNRLLKPLAEYFEMNQLPNMDRLRVLILSGMNARLEKLMLEVYGPNLQSLKTSNSSEIPVTIWGNMQFLQTLSLYVSGFEQTMKILPAIQSPLQSLTLQTNDDSENVFKIDKFLLAVQYLPLKKVSIRPDSGILKESVPFPVEFPKHETILKLSIEYCQVYSPNFFQFLPNLQSFVVNEAKCLAKLYSNNPLPVCCLQSNAITLHNTQNMDPLDYMVEDCWLHLFQFLSARDKQALCQTCLTFEAMLEPQKASWGLELILPCIQKELSSNYNYFDKDRYKTVMKSVLTLRQVCKSWRDGFDKYCGTLKNERGYYLPIRDIQQRYHFNYDSRLEKFLTVFKDHQGNPFIGRSVSIYAESGGAYKLEKHEESSEIEVAEVKDEGNNEASEKIGIEEVEKGNEENKEYEEDDDFNEEEDWRRDQERERRERMLKHRQLLMELLAKFGKEIENLYFDRMRNCSLLDAYIFLQTILSYCPNLQSLDVHIYRNMYLEEREEAILKYQNRLAEYFKMNQLPKMRRLRELKLCKMNALAENAILEALGPNLQSLVRNNTLEIPVAIWGNMQCLQNLSMYLSSFEQIETLLRAINSPLKTLTLGKDPHDDDYSEKVFKIDKFLLAVQHLPLTEVAIWALFGILKEDAPFPANFPKHHHILKFSVEECRLYSPSFLQFLPNLQSFVINGAKCPMKLYFNK